MTLNISLAPDVEAKLTERASAAGQDVREYATRLLEEAIASPSVEELLAPFRQGVQDSGMSDDDLDRFYEGLRRNVAEDTRAKPQ